MFVGSFRNGRCVNYVVVSRVVQNLIQAYEHVFQHRSQLLKLLLLRVLEGRLVNPGDNPYFKREPRLKRGDGNEFGAVGDDPHTTLRLLPDDVAKNAALLEFEILPGPINLLPHPLGHHRQGDQLGVGMLQRGACSLTVVLKNHNVFETPVLFQVQDPVTIGPEHILDLTLGEHSERLLMIGGLNDDLVRAEPIHLVIKPLTLAV